MIASIIVFGSIAFAAGFCVAWLVRPEIRAWLETPKHRFQENVQRYDRSAVREGPPEGGHYVRADVLSGFLGRRSAKREGGSRTSDV